MKISVHTLNQLKQIAENVDFTELDTQKVPELKINEFTEALKKIVSQVQEFANKSNVDKETIEEIIIEGIAKLTQVGLKEKVYKEHAAKYLKEIVKTLDLNDELKIYLYLWPVS